MENTITWFELPSSDFDRACKFYGDLLAVEINKSEFGGMPYGFFPMEMGNVSGAVVSNPNYKPGGDGAVVFLNTEGKLDAVLGRVESAGGSVVMPKTDIGSNGHIALIIDTEGNKVGLHQAPAS